MGSNNKKDRLQEWKKLYAEAIIKGLQPFQNILQIGFGAGDAAAFIQKSSPKKHTILESKPELVQKAKDWAQKYPQVQVVQGDWKSGLSSLGTFDAIFYNCACSEGSDQIILNYLFPEEITELSNQAKTLLGMLQDEMAHATAHFSDQDVEDFYQHIGRQHPQELPSFFKKLKDNKNITKEQYEHFSKKYKLAESGQKKTPPAKGPAKVDSLLECLEESVRKHLTKGGRFSAFLLDQQSKHEDSAFYDRIITNANLEYQENTVKIPTSDKSRNAIVITVKLV